MRRRHPVLRPRILLAGGALGALLLLPGTASRAAGSDPAERGLDLFIHAPTQVIAGDVFAVDLRAYGFATVTKARPLPGAAITAAWDPGSLGAGTSSVPADIVASTDPTGSAQLTVPVPPGDARQLVLLVALRYGEHVRTRAVTVERRPRTTIELRVADALVVPGSRVPAWLTAFDARTSLAVGNASVDVGLFEGPVERASNRVVTDGAGLARASLVIPAKVSGALPLSIRARLVAAIPGTPIESTVALGLREESPAMPRLTVAWRELQLRPGEVGHAAIRLLDATDEPLAGHAVLTWTGPKGTTPPATDEAWKKVGVPGRTDGLGALAVETTAPRVVTARGSEVTIVARADVEGQKLEQRQTVLVGQPVAAATLTIEGGVLVPGLAQRAFLHVTDGAAGVAGELEVTGDGLQARVVTDPHGDGELTWTVPNDIGAARAVGPCAGGVAAAVAIRQPHPIPALSRHPEPFELCVAVDRERGSILRMSVQVARIGEKVRPALVSARRTTGLGSLVLSAPDGSGDTLWATPDAEIDLARATPGLHTVSLAVPGEGRAAETTATHLLVVPRLLPRLAGRLAGGRLAPGGEAEVEAVLDDGHGHPLIGAVTALLVDREGGGSVAGLDLLDTRIGLCEQAGAPRERCDAFLEGDADLLRRQLLGTTNPNAVTPRFDPAAHASAALVGTFSEVLHSLEGAVYQSETPESLRDVRRKEKGQWVFNPELMTLVTAALKEPPTTPGGEPFGLADLVAVDPQVTFDAVARRITRLKIFNALSAARSFRAEEHILDEDEPILRDPAALLRRMVRAEKLAGSALMDPWGGSIQFVRTGEPAVPFLTVARGFALRSPGPDGVIGTPDDVKDPFERVVRSKTPYATAMGEDEIVDARLDMRVAEATVSGWQEMFARLTGTELGGGGTGTGKGFGSGNGRLGGAHAARAPAVRTGRSIAIDAARWTEPVRTDAEGRVKLRVPLGDRETTWRIALLARSDSGQSAVSSVDVPAFLPISARVDIGQKLTEGDEVAARIIVRNRTKTARRVSLDVSASGGLAMLPKESRRREVDVPAGSVRSIFAWFGARSEGTGNVTVAMTAGAESDRTSHEVVIEPPGEARLLGAAWTLPAHGRRRMTLRVAVPPGYLARGQARLVVESGHGEALRDALESVAPEASAPPEALADAVEVAARIEKLAEARSNKALGDRARSIAALANAYLGLQASAQVSPVRNLAIRRAALHTTVPPDTLPKASAPECLLPEHAGISPALLIEAEPPSRESGPLACFTELVGKLDSRAPLDLARAVLALVDRPHRAPLATELARELARVTRAEGGGGEPAFDGPQADRTIVTAALARTTFFWTKDVTAQQRLLDLLLSLRDARGGYGSSEATRDVVRVLTSATQVTPLAARLVVRDGDTRKVLDVSAGATTALTLGAKTTSIELEATGGPVFVRLVRPMLRTFTGPPESAITPVLVSADWPTGARVGTTGVVHVAYRLAVGRPLEVMTTIPLPPGVELAAPVKDVSIRQGVLHVRTRVTANEALSLPVRFTLPGRVVVPESETRALSEAAPRTLTPARTLTISQ